jgi:hypothetical protein
MKMQRLVYNVSLSLLLSVSLSLRLAAQPDDPLGRWQLETVTLRDESKLEGLVQGESKTEIDFAQIVQPPGKPMYAVIRGIPRSDVLKIHKLEEKQHEQLVGRFARFRNRAVIEAGRMDEVLLEESPRGGGSLEYRGPWFTLTSAAAEEPTRRSIVRIEQMFRAYRTLLPPRVERPQRLEIELFGSLDQYRGRLRGLDLSLESAAFYSPRERTILAGSDLDLFAERLQQVRREHEAARRELEQLEAEHTKTLAALSAELKAAGFSAEEAAAEIRQRKAAWTAEIEALSTANLQRARANEQKFGDVTRQMFLRLDHEAFHAYLDTYVFPHEKGHVPRWLNEGLAQIFETGQFDGESLRIDAPDRGKLAALRADLAGAEPLSLGRLLLAEEREFLGPHGTGLPQRHYLYSWGLAWYLAFDQNLLGSSRLEEYVAVMSKNPDPLAAFEKFTGQPLGQFERAWRKAMLER